MIEGNVVFHHHDQRQVGVIDGGTNLLVVGVRNFRLLSKYQRISITHRNEYDKGHNMSTTRDITYDNEKKRTT